MGETWTEAKALAHSATAGPRGSSERPSARTIDAAGAVRALLRAVPMGVAVVDADGVIASERSAEFERHLGRAKPGTTLPDLLARHDPAVAEWLRVGWELVFSGDLPVEAALDQLPRSLVSGSRTLALSYAPADLSVLRAPVADGLVADDDAESGPVYETLTHDIVPAFVIVTVVDVTADVERERGEREQRESFHIFQRFVSDPSSVIDFSEDALELVAELQEAKAAIDVALRIMHTLKGNAASFDLRSIASLCHDLETRIVREQRPLTRDELGLVRQRIYSVVEQIRMMAGQRGRRIDVAERDLNQLCRALESGTPPATLVATVRHWRWQHARPRFLQFGAQAESLARRLGKDVNVVVDVAEELRFPPEALRAFFAAFVHVVRNAVDHGLEDPGERQACGKSAPPTVRFEAHFVDDGLEIVVADDGRGIDWDRVRAKAQALSLPCETEDQLRAALLSDGFSTREEVSETSGRGVGMAVVQYAVDELGGSIHVDSERGVGTTWRFRLPVANCER